MVVKKDHVQIMLVQINLILHLMLNVIIGYLNVHMIVPIKYVLKKAVLTFLNLHLHLLIVNLGIQHVLLIQQQQVVKREIVQTIHMFIKSLMILIVQHGILIVKQILQKLVVKQVVLQQLV